jgi:hypothetical protein
VIAGESGRYWLAERNRWQQGVELTQPDFRVLLEKMRGPAAVNPYRLPAGQRVQEEHDV